MKGGGGGVSSLPSSCFSPLAGRNESFLKNAMLSSRIRVSVPLRGLKEMKAGSRGSRTGGSVRFSPLAGIKGNERFYPDKPYPLALRVSVPLRGLKEMKVAPAQRGLA